MVSANDTVWNYLCTFWTPNFSGTVPISVMMGITGSQDDGTGNDFGIDDVEIVAIGSSPAITITPSSATICNGQSVNLTASGTSTYQWSPSTGLNCTTCASVTASPTVTTTYTVTGTDAIGCTGTATVTVTVNSSPTVTVSPSAPVICNGGSVVLTASGANTYQWSPATGLSCTTCANPTASPTVATTYTVTGTSSGCSGNAIVTVTVDQTCCTPPNAQPQYTIPPSGDFSSNPTYNNGFVNVTTPVIFNGNFTVNTTTFTISGCPDVQMKAGVQIIILANCSLVVQNSRLYACQNLWDGIVIQPGGTLIVDQNSIIEDATNAVNSLSTATSEGKFFITNSTLNKNIKDVVVQASLNSNYQSSIYNTTLTCQADGTFSPTVFIKAPAPANSRTNTGVEINGSGTASGTIFIGDPANPVNTFSIMDLGIHAVNYNLTVQRNNFTGLTGSVIPCPSPSNCPDNGVAVWAEDPNFNISAPATFNTLVVGGTGTQVNNFTDCRRGVLNQNYVNIQINGNTFLSNYTRWAGPFITNLNGESGILIENRYSQQLDIMNNSLTNQFVGIHVMRNNAVAVLTSSINISSNSLFAGTASAVFMNVGIFADDIISSGFSPGNFYNINDNTVFRANTCIWARNITENGLRIFTNPVLFIRPTTTSASPGPNKAGIRVENCNQPLIANNPFTHSTGTVINSANNRNVRGIYITKSIASVVVCNYVTNTGQSIVFEGACNNSFFRLNAMQNAYDGFVMRNNALISAQGSSTDPISDLWLGGFVFSQTFTENTFNVNINSPIWVNPGPLTKPTNNQSNVNDIYFPNTTFTFSPATCPSTGGGTGFFVNTTRRQLVQNQVPFSILIPETQLLSKQGVFKDLLQVPSLMLNDPVLQQFFTASQTTGIGKVQAVQTQLAANNTAAAQSINSSITPSGIIESNHKLFNSIYLSTLAMGNTNFSQQQINDLNAIAAQCPLAGGDAVLQARGTLDYISRTALAFIDNCPTGSSGRYVDEEVAQADNTGNAVEVYPNPNYGSMTVSYNIPDMQTGAFMVFDVTGRKLAEHPLMMNVNSINITENLNEGVYFYKVIANGAVVSAGKITIIK